jgi:hypothetical protein
MTDYSNILNALRGNGLDRQAENLRAFDELTRQGVRIPDLLKRIEDLEAQVKDRPPASQDESVFSIMASAVEDDPEVVSARDRRERAMETVLTEACLKDPRFADADREWRSAVNAAYVRLKG